MTTEDKKYIVSACWQDEKSGFGLMSMKSVLAKDERSAFEIFVNLVKEQHIRRFNIKDESAINAVNEFFTMNTYHICVEENKL